MTDASKKRNGTAKTPKIRASCDSCNEAKIRCSQARPRCTRCIKNRVQCVYGISQRSGKHTAESYNAITRSATSIWPSTPSTTSTHIETPKSRSPVDLRDSILLSPEPTVQGADLEDSTKEQQKQWAFDNIFLPNDPSISQEMSGSYNYHSMFATDDSLISKFQQTSPALDNTQSSSLDEVGLVASSQYSNIQYNQKTMPCVSYTTNHKTNRPLTSGVCRCSEIVIVQLSLLPLLLRNERGAFDAELIQFQEAVKLCDGVLSCTCASKDYTCVLTVSILIARIISVFDGDGRSPSQNGDAMAIDMSPKFSLGMYQIEGEDESKLKQEVWWLQIKKVELLVAGFKGMVSQVRQQQAYQDYVQTTAFEKLTELLDQKIQAVKRDWVANRDKA